MTRAPLHVHPWMISGFVHCAMVVLVLVIAQIVPPELAPEPEMFGIELVVEPIEEPPVWGWRDSPVLDVKDEIAEFPEECEFLQMPEPTDLPDQVLKAIGIADPHPEPIWTIGRRRTRTLLLNSGEATVESETVVALGLIWLAKQQQPNGSWVGDGSEEDDSIAATGMGLLPYLAVGQTHKVGKYTKVVSLALTYLRTRLKSNGAFRGDSGMVGHAIATLALCDAYAISRDRELKRPAQLAIDFIVASQSKNGGWGYTPGAEGDTMNVGWQLQALQSARLADLAVPPEVWKKASHFLDSVSNEARDGYGYQENKPTLDMTAVGLLCRELIDGWGPGHPILAKGVARLLESMPGAMPFDVYYLHHATRVIHRFGGPDWLEKWNPSMRDVLVKNQVKIHGKDRGSWDTDLSIIGTLYGRFGTTCFSILTLEVYYRYAPRFHRAPGS